MSHLLQKLENNEAILLMYLADELDTEERAEVEQMLSVDAGMRAELERLRAAQTLMEDRFSQADRAAELPVQERVVVRQVGRIIRQWKVDKARRVVEPPESRGLRYPWWTYPSATAAAILIAFLVWFGNHDGPLVDRTDPLPQGAIARVDTDELELVVSRFQEAEEFMQDEVRRESVLSAVETELLALSRGESDVLGLNTVDSY